MPWFGKCSDFETDKERLERRVEKLEEEKRRRDAADDNFSMTSQWCGGDD
jgi:hypothetical protein